MNASTLERWTRLWRQVNTIVDPEPVYHDLVSRYSEPQRHYHNLAHIDQCLAEFDSVRQLAAHPLAVELAIWFHDAIYDPRAGDNEEKSAALAGLRINELGGNADLCQAVGLLVMATKAHDSSLQPDAPLLVDVDLSILGQSQQRFQAYEAQIRREYEWVPERTFATRRAQILEGFLARKRIYTTDHFFDRYEQQARTNLLHSARRLTNL